LGSVAIFTAEYGTIGELDRELIESQVNSISSIAISENLSELTVDTKGRIDLTGVIDWHAALKILMEILEKCDQSNEGVPIQHHISDVVRDLVKVTPGQPISFCLPPISVSWYRWTVSITPYCKL
jgi:ABC-type transporter Mla MlaB component